MILTAFTGYILPWGQMSYWAATVITNLVSAVPLVGGSMLVWLWGGYSLGAATLTRFFSLHYLLPFIIVALVIMHVVLLHDKGSSNRLSIIYTHDKSGFHPKYTIKDLHFISIIMIFYIFVVGFYPNFFGHPDNYIPADPFVTPKHIVPEWYFLPFFAILRSISSKLGGLILIVMSLALLAILPYLFTTPEVPYRDEPILTLPDGLLLKVEGKYITSNEYLSNHREPVPGATSPDCNSGVKGEKRMTIGGYMRSKLALIGDD